MKPDNLFLLHSIVADTLLHKIQSGEDATAPMLNVARQFLNDNGIKTRGNEQQKLTELFNSLPRFEDTKNH